MIPTASTHEQLMVRIVGVQAEALLWEEAGGEIALELQWSFFGVP